MHFIPGCRLRCSEEAEIIGIDDAEMGEFAYDYVGIDAELGPKVLPPPPSLHEHDGGKVESGSASVEQPNEKAQELS
jgi:hypothetical protein